MRIILLVLLAACTPKDRAEPVITEPGTGATGGGAGAGGAGGGSGGTGGAGGTGGSGGAGGGGGTGGTGAVVVDQFGPDTSRTFTVIGTDADKLRTVRDIAFHPTRPEELWTINQDTDGVVIFFDPGTPGQTSLELLDIVRNHFMEEVSSLAFGSDDDSFASCQESRNTYDGSQPPDDFMGPVLWPGGSDVFAQANQGAFSLGSHIDMLHQSPNCMGIAWDKEHVYWVFDGFNSELVRYDFADPHVMGGDDHADGIIQRWEEVTLTRVAGVPGQMELDPATGLLYIADTGASRVLVVDTATGTSGGVLPLTNEPLDTFVRWVDNDAWDLVTTGLTEPSGLDLHDGTLFVSDHATGEIIAFDLDGNELQRISTPEGVGIMGIEVGPDGLIHYVNGVANVVVRVDAGT